MQFSALLSLRLLGTSGAILLASNSLSQSPSAPEDVKKTTEEVTAQSKAEKDKALAQSVADLKKQAKALQASVKALQATRAKQQDDAVKAKDSKADPVQPIPPQESAPAADPAPTDEPATAPAADPGPTDEPATAPAADPAPTDEPATAPAADPAPTDEPATAPAADESPDTSAQAQILADIKAQSKALEERVKALEALLEKQSKELTKARAEKTAATAPQVSVKLSPATSPKTAPATATATATAPTMTQTVTPSATNHGRLTVTISAAEATDLVSSNPVESPTSLLAEMTRRYVERFGETPALTPANNLDFDDFSNSVRRWTIGQNRILCQPIDWNVRVLRMESSKQSSDKLLLLCQAVGADGTNVGDEFHAKMDRSPNFDLVKSSPKGTMFHLIGVIDPRLDFSAEHGSASSWSRDGVFVAPYCVSHWSVTGQKLTSDSSGQSSEAPSDPTPSIQ